MSSSSTSQKRSAPDTFTERNKDFINKFKKEHGSNLVQTKLPTAVELQDQWTVTEGNSLADSRQWRALCERVKFTTTNDKAALELMHSTLDMSEHVGVHPIELIGFARRNYGMGLWTMATIAELKRNMLADTDDEVDADDDDEPDENDPDDIEVNLDGDREQRVTSAEAYEIDGDSKGTCSAYDALTQT